MKRNKNKAPIVKIIITIGAYFINYHELDF